MIEAVVAGHICLDIIPTLASGTLRFEPGRLIEAGPAVLSTGGPVSNTGLTLHKLGVTTRLMGKVGTDLFGQAIRTLVAAHGPELATGMIVVPGEISSYSVILSAPDTDRILIHAPGCNATFGADDVRYDLVESAQVFHFGYPPLMAYMYEESTELATLLRHVKDLGVTTSLDMSMPDSNSPAGRANWHAILFEALPYVDIFMPGLEEMLLLLPPEQAKLPLAGWFTPEVVMEMAASLLNLGAKIVGLKLGNRGLYLRTADLALLEQMGKARPTNLAAWAKRELWAPCFEVQVAGTTGAGDATIAGFLLGLLRGMTPEQTLTAASAVGACSVEAADALSAVRNWPDTDARIAAGWPRLPLALDLSDWRWDEEHGVWVGPRDAYH